MANNTILCEKKADRLLVRIPGEIDHHSAAKIREEIDRSLFYHRPKTLVLNLSEVSFMDSSGLGLILGRFTRMKELGGTLVIADPTEQIMKILRLAGLNRMIAVENTSTHSCERTEKQ